MMSIEVIGEQSGTQMQLRRDEGRGRGIYGSTLRAAFCRGWRYSSESSGTGHPVEVVEVIYSCDLSASRGGLRRAPLGLARSLTTPPP
jgi:hypothetical protein